jgi:hypothetical protein
MSLIVSQRAYFKTPLFNETTQSFLSTVFASVVRQYTLVSAKGSSGRKFKEERLRDAVIALPDMPYHIHILNGLFPALKLLEEQLQTRNLIVKPEIVSFVKTLCIAFMFHDSNKLIGKELDQVMDADIESLCDQTDVKSFFPEWRQWLGEIKFLILRTENRTSAYAYEKKIREWQFINEVLGAICHLADLFASLTKFRDVAEFYDRLCLIKVNGKPIADIWQLSFIEVSDNIFTLLSQRLINTAKDFIWNNGGDILFNLRNGFVFIGQPLEESNRNIILQQFCDDDNTFDAVAQTQINSLRGCQFGFIESRRLTSDILSQIIEAGYKGNSRIKFIEILKDANSPNTEGFEVIAKLIDQLGLPVKPVLPDKLRNKKIEEQRYSFVIEPKWDDLDIGQKNALTLLALQRIKFMKKDQSNEWEKEFTDIETHSSGTLSSFTNAYSRYTVAAIASAGKKAQEGHDLAQICETTKHEIVEILSKDTVSRNDEELKSFAKLYLTGNFDRDIEFLLNTERHIPEKKDMCLFTGRSASENYGSAKAHGIKALGFSNRTVNTLKTAENRISSLFNYEIEMRKGLINDTVGFNSCIYYDFGEYILSIDTRKVLDVLSQAKGFQHDEQNFQMIIDEKAFKYNLYGMNFEKISENVEGNFYFIQRNLKLIKSTGFRLFTTSIISPYHSHNEMFVFDNCMPFVKRLGWDRIRIDDIEGRLSELNLFLTLGAKRLTSNVLEFVEDRRSLFSAFQGLDEEDKTKARPSFTSFVYSILPQYHKEYSMGVMKELAEIAIKMARPQSGSSSQETRLIRDSLGILRVCHKEGRDTETTVGQIVGELRQLSKTYGYFNENLAPTFACRIYDDLFKKEWGGRFPQPSRLRHWINEFGFWYSTLNFEQMKVNVVQKAIDALKADSKQINEDSVIEWLKQSDHNKKKSIDNYENDYRNAFKKLNNQRGE